MNASPNRSQSLSCTEVGMDAAFSEKSLKMRFCSVKDAVTWIGLITCGIVVGLLCVKVSRLEHSLHQSHGEDYHGTPKNRLRRDSNPDSDGAALTGWNALGSSSNFSPPFIHVTHITSSELEIGDWFTWHSDEEEAYQQLATSLMPMVHNKFVQINQAGYYFVYSQITYSDTNNFEIGHEMVKKSNCGNGTDHILLSSKRTQTDTIYQSEHTIYPLDSGFVGGVFYFSANDYIGVRPLSPQAGIRRFDSLSMTDSYFGVFMLASDPNARVAEWGDCCVDNIMLHN